MLRLLLTFALLLLPAVPAAAQSALQGSWAFHIDDAVIFRFDIVKNEEGEWSGNWTRPDRFFSNGVDFSDMIGSEEISSMAGLTFLDYVELSFDDPRPGAIPDIFRFEQTGEDTAMLIYVGTQLDPYPLIRVDAETPIGPFDENRVYNRRDALKEKVPESDDEEAAQDEEQPEEPEPASRLGADFLDGL